MEKAPPIKVYLRKGDEDVESKSTSPKIRKGAKQASFSPPPNTRTEDKRSKSRKKKAPPSGKKLK